MVTQSIFIICQFVVGGLLVNYCGVVKSKTATLKFERVYDLTWVLTDGNSYVGTNVGVGAKYSLEANLASLPVLKRDILELANQDVFGMNRTTDGEAYNLENGIEGEAYVGVMSQWMPIYNSGIVEVSLK